MLAQAKQPLIVADYLYYPLGLQDEINKLIRMTNIPAMSYTSAKGIVDETLPSWSPDLPNTTDCSRNCDLLLLFGPLLSDTNTTRWTAIPPTNNVVSFCQDSVIVPNATKLRKGNVKGLTAANLDDKKLNRRYPLKGKKVLTDLVSTIEADPALQGHLQWPAVETNRSSIPARNIPTPSGPITQDDFWPSMSAYLKPEDTILLANGTPLIGGRALQLPSNCQVVASPIWNAIGSMLPAAQGIAAAKRDHQLPGRTILFEGDGSFQVTCQAVSDMIRYKLDVTIFIVNNAGYTYERWLNGMDAEYNDAPSWQYVDAPKFFGAQMDDPSYPVFSRRAETWEQLSEVLAEEKANDGKGLKIFDVVMDLKDVPHAAKPGLQRPSEALRI